MNRAIISSWTGHERKPDFRVIDPAYARRRKQRGIVVNTVWKDRYAGRDE
jgi:hypothetical protein